MIELHEPTGRHGYPVAAAPGCAAGGVAERTVPGTACPGSISWRPGRRVVHAAVLVVASLLLLTAAVANGWTTGLDQSGRHLTGLAGAQGVGPALHLVERAFDGSATRRYAAVLAVVLLLCRALRLAVLALAATWGTTYATTSLKHLVGRDRPAWQLSEGTLDSFAFPSGHASSVTALVGVLVVVAWTCAAGSAAQWAITAAVGGSGSALVVLVAADRVLMGRHYPADVLGGVLTGSGVVLALTMVAGLAGSSPQPASTPRRSR